MDGRSPQGSDGSLLGSVYDVAKRLTTASYQEVQIMSERAKAYAAQPNQSAQTHARAASAPQNENNRFFDEEKTTREEWNRAKRDGKDPVRTDFLMFKVRIYEAIRVLQDEMDKLSNSYMVDYFYKKTLDTKCLKRDALIVLLAARNLNDLKKLAAEAKSKPRVSEGAHSETLRLLREITDHVVMVPESRMESSRMTPTLSGGDEEGFW